MERDAGLHPGIGEVLGVSAAPGPVSVLVLDRHSSPNTTIGLTPLASRRIKAASTAATTSVMATPTYVAMSVGAMPNTIELNPRDKDGSYQPLGTLAAVQPHLPLVALIVAGAHSTVTLGVDSLARASAWN